MMTLGWTLFTRNVSKSIVENGLIGESGVLRNDFLLKIPAIQVKA